MTLECTSTLSNGRVRIYSISGLRGSGTFTCEIKLDDDLISKPKQTVIKGKLVISAAGPIRCSGIRVQLNASVNLKFNTKADKKFSNTYKKHESLLKGASDPGIHDYILSPVREDVYTGKTEFFEAFVPDASGGVGWSSISYPFSLEFPEEILPSPFKSQYGDLEYKVAAYMIRLPSDAFVEIGDYPIRFKGYNNLSQHRQLLEPIKHETTFHNSKNALPLTGVLTLEKRGFLPGEDLNFELNFDNPSCFVAKKFCINLVQLKIYNANGAKKTMLEGLDFYENKSVNKNPKISYKGKLTVPLKNCIPTYTEKAVYSVLYLLNYQLTVGNNHEPLKGRVEVIIGTTKDSPVEDQGIRPSNLRMDVNSILPVGVANTFENPISSKLPDNLETTKVALPPGYSQLPSKAMSVLSIETLPPHYDDLEDFDI